MGKEIIKERKCLVCGEILPRKSRADKKTCSSYCRKKSSLVSKVGNTEYRNSEVSKDAKELFSEFEKIKNEIENAQDLVLYSDTIKTGEDKGAFKEKFKLHLVYILERIQKQSERLINKVVDTEITELQNILDELDDRDNDRNDNLYF